MQQVIPICILNDFMVLSRLTHHLLKVLKQQLASGADCAHEERNIEAASR